MEEQWFPEFPSERGPQPEVFHAGSILALLQPHRGMHGAMRPSPVKVRTLKRALLLVDQAEGGELRLALQEEPLQRVIVHRLAAIKAEVPPELLWTLRVHPAANHAIQNTLRILAGFPDILRTHPYNSPLRVLARFPDMLRTHT